MTGRTAAFATLAILAGCSSQPPAPAAEQDTSAAPAGAPQPTPPVSGERLTASVSGLSADSSGLNVRITDRATIVELPTDTLFEFDRADLTPAATDNLGKAADAIRRGAPGAITIVGHTDSKGSDAYNQPLSERRAQAVADWMKQQVGVRQRDFTVVGKGESAPVVPDTRADGSDDPAARTRNRRVEIVIPR